MKRIAIDMDEVMADTMSRYLELYNADFDLAFTPEHFHGRHVFEVIDAAHPDKYPVPITADDYLQERLREIKLA